MNTAVEPWLRRVNTAYKVVSENRLTALFTTWTTENESLKKHNGELVSFKSLIIEPNDAFFDGESLPFFYGEFPDGDVLVCGFDEVFSHDYRVIELINAVNSGFSLCRDKYATPFELEQCGTEDEKKRFSELVSDFDPGGVIQSHHTPLEYVNIL